MQRLSERRRAMGAGEETSGFYIRGKFRDDSSEEDWKWRWNGANDFTSIAQYVDKETKEFEIELEEKPKSLANLFQSNSALERIEEISGTELAQRADYAFSCPKLVYADFSKFDASSLKHAPCMFYGDASLVTLKLRLNPTLNEDYGQFFYNCYSLRNLELDVDFGSAVGHIVTIFQNCWGGPVVVTGKTSNIKLNINIPFPSDPDSIMVFFNGLAPVEEPQTITINASVKSKLTPEQRAVAENKGWIIA